MLRADLAAAEIDSKRGDCEIDFHAFRAFAITRSVLSGKSSRVVMAAVRLSSESLLARYTKIAKSEVEELVEAVPPPCIALKMVG